MHLSNVLYINISENLGKTYEDVDEGIELKNSKDILFADKVAVSN